MPPSGSSPERQKVLILGGGPNRIGRGTEFDYLCVHASLALREECCESIIANSNPCGAPTDASDVSDRLYLEPLVRENVLDIIEREKPDGIVVSFDGRMHRELGSAIEKTGVKILGTSRRNIDRATDRKLLGEIIRKLNLRQADGDSATSVEEALTKANGIGYPLLVKTSVAADDEPRRIVYDDEDMASFARVILETSPGHTAVMNAFLEDAVEVDVDAISDGETTLVCGVMEHIEQAGVHSGDSACSLPPYSLSKAIVDEIKRQTCLLAGELEIRGLMNVHYAVKDGDVFILEVNPRASRTVPFVSKATGIPWAKLAVKVMLGDTLKAQGMTQEITPLHVR